jgi:uncharacterized membrane protein
MKGARMKNIPASVLRAADFAALLRDTRGLAAVELALVLPIVLLLLGGVIDFSRFATQRTQVRAAAQAGADYALRKGWNASSVTSSISASSALSVTALPAPRIITACLSGSQIIETASSTCATGIRPGRYVVSSARATFSPLMPWPGIILPATLEGAAFARIE